MGKTVCNKEECTGRVAMLIGDCKYCKSQFCGKHRLPEDHQCAGMKDCRQAHFDKNANKLMSEKCLAAKV